MEIENEKGIFDLEKNSAISIERTNPLLSEQGSMSLPYSIKRTDKNDYLLGDPQNYERKDAFQAKQDMNIRSGLLNENATFEMLSVDADKVEGVFYLYESSFYSRIKEVKLAAVFDGVERWFQPESVPREERINYILDMFENMIRSSPDYSGDFTVFPVASNCEFSSRTLWGITQGTTDSQNVINEVYRYYEPGTSFTEMRLKAKEAYEYTDDEGNLIRIPIGYGVSPFLRFGYILRKIFEYFDLTLEPTIFETEKVFQRFVIVNNTQDAVMPGYFIESQLVPDCTINEFLDIIREGMCGDFIIDVPNRKAKLVFFKDVVNAQPDEDLSQYITSKFEKIEFNQPKQVRLSVGKSLPHAETATDTLDEFKKKYPKYNPIQPILGIPEGDEDEGIYPFYSTNSIWKMSEPIHEWITSTYKMDFISSMNFDYVTNDDLESEEHKVPFESPITLPILTASDFNSYNTMIIGTLRNLNSLVILDGVKQAEESTECPIIMAIEQFYGSARAGVINADTSNPSLIIGPQYPFLVANISMFISLNTWSQNGLFNKHWKEYDTLLRTSFHPITYIARLPANLLQNFTFDRLKLIEGQPLIPVSLKYEMTDQPLIKVEMLFKTVKKYGLDDSSNPETDPQELNFFVGKWSMASNTEYPDSLLTLQMNSDYSGKFYAKYKNWVGIDVEQSYSFHKVTVQRVTFNGITYKVVELITSEPYNIQMYVVDQTSEAIKSFRLLNSELPVIIRQV